MNEIIQHWSWASFAIGFAAPIVFWLGCFLYAISTNGGL